MAIGIVKMERRALSPSGRLYLPAIFGGMIVTIRHLLKNLFNMKGLPTIQYPEVKRVYSGRFRGRHILTTREDGTTRCVACFMCSTACPAECITIEAGEDDRTREKFPVRYDIDLLRCIFCGYCVDACPEDAIYMTRDYEMAIDTRARSVVGSGPRFARPEDGRTGASRVRDRDLASLVPRVVERGFACSRSRGRWVVARRGV